MMKDIEKKMEKMRMRIPAVNRNKYDIETADIYAAICAESDEEKKEILFADWKERAAFLASDLDAAKAPPRLIRKDGETAEMYLDRIFERIGICRMM